jgi:hypothetical protein
MYRVTVAAPSSTIRLLFLVITVFVTGCTSRNDAEVPRAIFAVSSQDYAADQLLAALDSLSRFTGPRVDRLQETIVVGGKAIRRLDHLQVAYWYPVNQSKAYGIALAQWRGYSMTRAAGAEPRRDGYYVEVYAHDDNCSLCESVRRALSDRKIAYFSACDHQALSTGYEKIRCGN